MKKTFFILIVGLCMGIHPAVAQYIKLFDFNGTKGYYPKGYLSLSGDVLYGMASMGGAHDMGCIFTINTDGSGYTNLLDFDGTTHGSYPQGSLTLSGDVLFGMTFSGGSLSRGCVFKINTNGTGYSSLHDFGVIDDGANPNGSLTLSGDTLFGMTVWGGMNSLGCIFRINTDGSSYQRLFDFVGSIDGSNPMGSLIVSGNVLYGMTNKGGVNDLGCVFSIHTDGSDYNKLLDFNGTDNGSLPWGALTLLNNVLYGMTRYGGMNDMGCLFSLHPDGTGYNRLLNFDGSGNGSYPKGSLIVIGDALLGMTSSGGMNDMGCIFKYVPQRFEYSDILDFNGTVNGSGPSSDLILTGDGLYGITTSGGSDDMGTIFKYVLPPATQTSNITFPFVGISVAEIQWTKGNGDKRAVFVKEGTGTITDPENNTTYTASTNWDSKGTQLGISGYYCVYNGTEEMVSVISLTPGTTYTVRGFEYNGGAGNEQYQTNTETGNPFTFQTEQIIAVPSLRDKPVQIYSDGSAIYAVIDFSVTKAELSVYNLSGVCIAQKNKLVEGQNKIAGDYRPGVYIVRLVLNDELYTQKIIIK